MCDKVRCYSHLTDNTIDVRPDHISNPGETYEST